MKYRQINTNFWEDSYILQLSDKEVKAFIFLFTNKAVTKCGIYQISEYFLLFQLHFTFEEWSEIKTKFQRDRKYFFKDEWVYINNFYKHSSFSTAPNVVKSIADEFNSVPVEILNHFFIILKLKYVIPIKQKNNETVMVKDNVMVIVMDNRLGGSLQRSLTERNQKNDQIDKILTSVDKYRLGGSLEDVDPDEVIRGMKEKR